MKCIACKLVLPALLLLLFGAIVNIAVAWGSAVTVNTWACDAEEAGVIGDDRLWIVRRHNAFGGTSYRSERARYYTQESRTWGTVGPADLTPAWAPFASGLPESARSAEWLIDSRGWPSRSMWSQVRRGFRTETGQWVVTNVEGGIKTPLPSWTALRIPRVLPLRLIWPGFAANTVFYTAVLLLITLVVLRLRRSHATGADAP
ncbi:MAG: hypothetical protein JSV91_12230 [Phycisphaerales bacterium]|nr:MAG: hypothetical protein JSV91_12230 [Phycisphaerales bacterium]